MSLNDDEELNVEDYEEALDDELELETEIEDPLADGFLEHDDENDEDFSEFAGLDGSNTSDY